MSVNSDVIPEGGPVHERVILAVAEANGVDQTELEPLYQTIDPEALDALFKPGVEGTIKFSYGDHDVVVRGDGDATIDGARVDVHPIRTIGLRDDDSEASATSR